MSIPHRPFRALLFVMLACASLALAARELDLLPGVRAAFIEGPEAVAVLTARDGYLEVMSPFDRASRMQTDRDVEPAEYTRFVAGQVRPWNERETAKVGMLLSRIASRMRGRDIPLPSRLLLIKTSGREEADAPYHRGAAIVLPASVLAFPDVKLETILIHELFHVFSAHNPPLRAKLYGAIGFEKCEALQLPAALEARVITNPDAPTRDACIRLPLGDATVTFFPLLLADSARYDTARGGTFFDYLQFKLAAAERRQGRWRVIMREDRPVLLDAIDVPAYLDRIGLNTSYIIHPEETMADNFVLWVRGEREVPSPWLIEAVHKVLVKEK